MAVVINLKESDTITIISILSKEVVDNYLMVEKVTLENMDMFTLEENAENMDMLRELHAQAVDRAKWLEANKELIIASCN